MTSLFPPHQVDQLRHWCRANSSRKFNARGIALQRCPTCLLGCQNCICRWRSPRNSDIEFVLIMHRDEVYKPTNTGRLIADTFPQHCHAFLWDRVNPAADLLQLLADPERLCVLVFPPKDGLQSPCTSPLELNCTTRRLTFVLLDGTWKQASKMAAQASWLGAMARLDLQALNRQDEPLSGSYGLRQADHRQRLSTAEAAVLCLRAAQKVDDSQILEDYFHVFNEHYLATRMNRKPASLAAHSRLNGEVNDPEA